MCACAIHSLLHKPLQIFLLYLSLVDLLTHYYAGDCQATVEGGGHKTVTLSFCPPKGESVSEPPICNAAVQTK